MQTTFNLFIQIRFNVPLSFSGFKLKSRVSMLLFHFELILLCFLTQVDRFNFPCGCSKDGCGNTQGRIEFNSRRVQTHYIHTAMRLKLEKRLQTETLSQEEQAELQEDLQQHVVQDEPCQVQSEQDKSCPFGFSMEEDALPLTMPPTPTFHFSPERLVEEENSCSSDMTESSSSSSDSDTGGGLNRGQSLPEVDEAISHSLDICDSENKNYSVCSQMRQLGEPLIQQNTNSTTSSTQTDNMRAQTDGAVTINTNRTLLTEYLDENANQSRDFFDDDSLEGFPHTPSPTVDYTSGMYMDLSLSSDSDLEFFDSDYPSGPLHSSFKAHRHTDNFYQPQLFSSVNLPQYESSTYLLESLIGLTEPHTEQGVDTQHV